MLSITVPSASLAHHEMAQAVKRSGEDHEGRHYKKDTSHTQEIIHSAVTITNPANKLVYTRTISPAFAIAEVIHILAGSNDLAYIAWWNPTIKNFSDDGVSLYGAYGARLGCDWIEHPRLPFHRNKLQLSMSTEDQLYQAYITLDQAPGSRQVVMNIYDHDYDLPGGSQPLSKDIPCNITSILSVRDGKLHWMQTMRSNDLIWGTPYNFIQWMTLMEIMAGWLGVGLGNYTHVVNSLHVYEQHYEELDTIAAIQAWAQHWPLPDSDLRLPYTDSKLAWNKLADLSVQMMDIESSFTNRISRQEAIQQIDEAIDRKDFPVAYQQLAYVLLAETSRKLELWKETDECILKAGRYWGTAMRKWFEQKDPGKSTRDWQQGWASGYEFSW